MELNKIYNQDCIEGMKQLDIESIDLILIDPPFNSELKMSAPFRDTAKTKMSDKEWFIYNEMSSRGYLVWMNTIFKEFYRVLKKKSHIYVFCNWKNIRNTMDLLEANFFTLKDVITWDKEHFGVGFFYRPRTEFIIFASKGKANKINSAGAANIFRIKRQSSPFTLVQKPVELIEALIKLSSKEGDVILDSFMCSGTTAIASINLKRNYIGFEINPDYCKFAENRIKELEQKTTELTNQVKIDV